MLIGINHRMADWQENNGFEIHPYLIDAAIRRDLFLEGRQNPAPNSALLPFVVQGNVLGTVALFAGDLCAKSIQKRDCCLCELSIDAK